MAKKKVTTEDLAVMMKNGFDGVDGQFKGVNQRLDKLEAGQEDIKLRLDRAAYKFELMALEKRVEVLEKQTGVAGSKVRRA